VSERGYFDSWEQLGIRDLRRAEFSVNHRQSQPLGKFVAGLHHWLYGEYPAWQPSGRRQAPLPRVRACERNSALLEATLEEIEHWRRAIPNATVAILSHGELWPGLPSMARELEARLADSLTEVRYAGVRSAGLHHLTQVDCVVVASVVGTKGLEFDAVVVIDPRGIWNVPLHEMDELTKNGLYVAASRAKQGLSLIMQAKSEIHSCTELQDLFVKAE
jgi:superfamily I DNA/RNA helicase